MYNYMDDNNTYLNYGLYNSNNNRQGYVYGFTFRSMKGLTFRRFFAFASAAFGTYLLCSYLQDNHPAWIYKKNILGYRVEYDLKKEGLLLAAALCGSAAVIIYSLILSISMVGLSNRELAGGSFTIDNVKYDYSIKGMRSHEVQLYIDGSDNPIMLADISDKSQFLPRLRIYNRAAYNEFRKSYFISKINGMTIRITVDGRNVCINESVIALKKKQIKDKIEYQQLNTGHMI